MTVVLKNLFYRLWGRFFSKSTPKHSSIPLSSSSLIDRILTKGLLPNQRPSADELPPVFSSETFSTDVARKISAFRTKGSMGFDAVEYRLTRADGQIRAAHIPHPVAYANLALAFERHWDHFPDIFSNENSYIRPRMHRDGRLIIMRYDSWLTKTLKSLKWRQDSRYIAHADIANFFPSIYTHSLGWAIDGIKQAKSSKGKAWYDDFDNHLRKTKRNETNGVLIGPVTSNLVTETILWRVDEKLK